MHKKNRNRALILIKRVIIFTALVLMGVFVLAFAAVKETDTVDNKTTGVPGYRTTAAVELPARIADAAPLRQAHSATSDSPPEAPVPFLASLDFNRRELTSEIMEQYPNGKFVPRKIHNEAWTIGEHLEFEVTYSFYSAGTATMSVLDILPVNGGRCYQIQTTARSNEFISSFYEVRDTVNSYIDTVGIFSRRFEKVLREGRYKTDRYVDFYPDRLIALNTRQNHALTEIPLYIQDILSSLYYIRTFDLEVGKNVAVVTYADGKVYPLKVIIHKRENVTVPAGTFSCLKIEPILQSEGIFRQKGKLIIWVTDDRYKIPVKMESKVMIGNIATKLVSYQTGVAR